MKKGLKVIVLLVLIVCSVILYFVIKEKTLPIYTMSDYGMKVTKDNREYTLSKSTETEIIGKRIGKGEFGGEKFYVYKNKNKEIEEYIILNSEIHKGYIGYEAIKK
jgi:hypothetical protein